MKLSRAIDWRFLEAQFGSVYSDGPGCPPLPTQLMAGLALLKHMYDLSDEALCDLWIENPYFQFFCGEEFFQHRLPFDRSSLTRWRQRMGEAKLTALIQESLAVATRTEAMKPKDLARVVVDTTVQPKAVMFTYTVPETLPPHLSQQALDYYVSEFTRNGVQPANKWYAAIDAGWAHTSFLDGATVRQPALFLTGERDPSARPVFGIDRQSAAFNSLRTNFRDLRDIIVMPGVGHEPPEERPEEINAIVLRFLRDISFQ